MTAKSKSGGSGRLIGCSALVIVLLLIGSGAAFLATQIPELAQQLPQDSAPLVVSLSAPMSGADIALNTATPVQAEAIGVKPITALELWVDGALVQVKGAPPGATSNRLSAFWSWSPASAGVHTLLVRATDADKRVGTSGAARVNATQDENATITRNYPVKSGESAASVAQKFKIAPQKIVDLNPGISADKPITPGAVISVPLPLPASPLTKTSPTATPPPPSAPAAPASPSKGDKTGFWIKKKFIEPFLPVPLPAAPEIALTADGCNVNVFITKSPGGVDGYFVNRLDPTASTFKRIATLDAGGASPVKFTDSSGLYGPLEYSVSAFNTAGESPSILVGIYIGDAACAKPEAKGIVLDKGKLTTTAPVDRVYCYLSVSAGPWTRVPPVPDSFIYPKTGAFDVGEYIKTLASPPPTGDITLELECWGWQGSTLVYLGKAKDTISATKKTILITAEKFKFAGGALEGILTPMSGTGSIPPIVSPANLTGTSDPKKCADHLSPIMLLFGGGEMCVQAAKDKYVILVWDNRPAWMTVCPDEIICNVDGYRVYQAGAGGKYTLVASATGSDWTEKAFPPPTVLNVCYIVRAFKDASESGDSNTFCLKSEPAGMQTAVLPQSDFGTMETLAAQHTDKSEKVWCKSFSWYLEKFLVPLPFSLITGLDTAGSGESFNLYQKGGSSFAVGYDNHYDAGTDPFPCWETADNAFRGVVSFDITSPLRTGILSDAFISKATLRFHNLTPQLEWRDEGGLMALENESCAREIKVAQVSGDDFKDIELYTTLSDGGLDFNVDVTAPVRGWFADKTPGAFILVGRDEGFPGNNNACVSRYGKFELEVNYFAGP